MARSTALILILWLAAGAALAQGAYHEDFSTSTFEDTLATTADWNTGTGQLGLPPFAPGIESSVPANYARASEIVGDYAVSGAALGGLIITDITDPAAPVQVGAAAVGGGVFTLDVDGPLIYIGARSSGLRIFDWSDPANPFEVGVVALGGFTAEVKVVGDYVYVANSGIGLQVVDVSDPATPILAATYATADPASGLDVHGGLLYLANDIAGLLILDVGDPTAPVPVGSLPPVTSMFMDVAVDYPYAYVAGWVGDLRVLDVSDPTAPFEVTSVSTSGVANGVEVRGDRLIVSDRGAGMKIFDITDPANPVLVGGTPVNSDSQATFTDGEITAVAGTYAGVVFVRSSWAAPRLIQRGSHDTPETAVGVAVQGGLAYVADTGALRILDVSNPGAIAEVGVAPGIIAQGVEVDGQYAYVSAYGNGVLVLDVSDPAAPVVAGSYDTPNFATSTTLHGDQLFVADFTSSLQILDVSEPTTPALLASYAPAGTPFDVAVEGNTAYLAMGANQVEIVDVTDPAAPAYVATANLGAPNALEVRGTTAYVATNSPVGLAIYDLSNPASPALIGSCTTLGGTFTIDVEVAGDRAFLAQSGQTIQTIDISDPTNPVVVAAFAMNGEVAGGNDGEGLFLAGRHLYAATAGSGLQVFQAFQDESDQSGNIGQSLNLNPVADPARFVRLSTGQTAGISWEVSADGGGSWQTVVPNNSWTALATPGADLRWRSTHEWLGANPLTWRVDLEWLYEFGPIAAISDVPDDQGGWVRLDVRRSSLDAASETVTPVTGYQIYQKIDGLLAARVLGSDAAPAPADKNRPVVEAFGNGAVRTLDGRTFVLGDAVSPAPGEKAAASFPAGVWEAVTWVAATQSDDYLVRCPTLADSTDIATNWSEYLVTTHTTNPAVWFVSPSAQGYSVDNIAPAVPTNLQVAYTADQVVLDWDDAPEADFRNYRVYAGDSPGFVPTPADLVDETTASNLTHDQASPWGSYFKVSTVDQAGNESEPAAPGAASGVDDLPTAGRTTLGNAAPNPFNPSTTISFDLPASMPAKLTIYDVSGRLVATLADGVQAAGRHEITWQGQDARGRPVGSGMYLYRLETPGFTETRRMALVK